MLVGRRMTKDPKTVPPDATLSAAADLMRRHGINHLPVVEGGKLVGIVSDTDLRNASLTSDHLPAAGGVSPSEQRVRDVMRTEVWSVTPEDSVEDALLMIARRRFGSLPVLSGDRLVGIITKIDLLNAFVDVLDIEEVGVRVEVALPRSLSRFEELVAAVREMGIELRSCLIAPEPGADRSVALLRLDTFDGPKVRAALRERRFEVLDPSPETF